MNIPETGTYIIPYIAVDECGNAIEEMRNVEVVDGTIVRLNLTEVAHGIENTFPMQMYFAEAVDPSNRYEAFVIPSEDYLKEYTLVANIPDGTYYIVHDDNQIALVKDKSLVVVTTGEGTVDVGDVALVVVV